MSELYHYGVLGMKWGVRKAKPESYRKAEENYRKESESLRRINGFGIKGIAKYSKQKDRVNKAELSYLDEKIKYKNRNKKGAKADKALKRFYRREMYKSGLRGSYSDTISDGRSTRLYNHMVETRGKKFADSIEKSVEKQAAISILGGTALILGSAAASLYMNLKY